MQSSKELVRSFFEGKPIDRPPFLPWICSLAAKLEQIPASSMFSDPGLLSRALSNAHKLFGYDVILNHFDPTLEAEALGCEVEWNDNNWPPVITDHPLKDGTDFYDLNTENIEEKGRIPVIIEATKRLILTIGKDVPIAAMITGPCTLAKHLRGKEFTRQIESEDNEALDLVEDAGSICLKLCRTYCELGVDIIVIAEDLQDIITQDVLSVLAPPLKSIFNVTKFFEVNSILISKVNDHNQAVSLCSLGVDAVSISGNINMDQLREKTRDENCRYSMTIPDSAFIQTNPENVDLIKHAVRSGESGYFLSSEWEIPRDADVNSMHQIMKIIHGE